MAFDPYQLSAATRLIEVAFGGQTLRAQYLFARYSSDRLAEIALAESKTEQAADRRERKLTRVLEIALKAYELAEGEQLDSAEATLIAAEDAITEFAQSRVRDRIVYLAGQLPDALASWDMTQADGSPFPLEKAKIAADIPYPLLTEIWKRINEAGNSVDPPKPAPSPGG